MTNIIEAIACEGIAATKSTTRHSTPRHGDHVRWPDQTLGRIDTLDGAGVTSKGEALVCDNQARAYCDDPGYISLSGGPFTMISLDDLEPTYCMTPSWFWNWGNLGSGAGNACEYAVLRPVFRYTGDKPPRAHATPAPAERKPIKAADLLRVLATVNPDGMVTPDQLDRILTTGSLR